MGLFSKLKTGLTRTFGSKKIGLITEQKAYGNEAENFVPAYIKNTIQNSIVKENIIIETSSGKSEIDCLVLLNDKLFIIEIKHWIGTLEEQDGRFILYKKDKYTDDVYEKEIKSPFSQVKRQARLLKEMTNSNPWINTIVFFAGIDQVILSSDDVCFVNIDELIEYLENEGKPSYPNQIQKCMDNIRTADFIYSSSFFGERSLHCIIDDNSLIFDTNKGKICRKDINQIKIEHHFTYDDIFIILKNSELAYSRNEKDDIRVKENGIWYRYSLNRIDKIILGE